MTVNGVSHQARAIGVLICAVAPFLVSLHAAAQGLPPPLARFLGTSIGLSESEMAAAAAGHLVVETLHPSDDAEVAVFGIIGIPVPRSFYVRRASDFPSALRSPSRLSLGVFSDPAVPSDVAAFSLPKDDVGDLAHCRPRSCKLKLPATSIEHLRAIVDSGGPSVDSMANAYFRARMLQYVSDYRAQGNRSLVVYDDDRGVPAARVFQAILSRSPYMYEYVPSLERYLEHYPDDRPPDIKEVIFWSLDDLGLKPVVEVTHEVVYSPPELPGHTLIVAKQLYADHFLDGALTLTGVVDRDGGSEADREGIYVLVLRRLHFDHLPGGLLDARGRVTHKLQDWTTAFLRDARAASTRAYAAAHEPGRGQGGPPR
jgi:hypothetical protein